MSTYALTLPHSPLSHSLTICVFVEVVLFTLINAFQFELSEKPIVWNFAGIAYPAANKDSSRPVMELRVSLADRA